MSHRKDAKKSALDYARAVTGRPFRLPVVGTEERDGKLYVTVEYVRPRWQRWLGSETRCRRTFGLDRFGREVYDTCNGKRSVETIAREFARAHRVSLAEAESSVTTFLKTLTAKGLIAIGVDRPDVGG